MGQLIVFFGGPDRTGKTTIAKKFAEDLKIPYFKPSGQKWFAMSDPNVFKMQTMWAEPKLLDFLIQTGYSAVIDRGFPCDWVYSAALDRDTAWNSIELLDASYSSLNAVNVFTLRGDYADVQGETWEKIDAQMLKKLDKLYRQYAREHDVPTLLLETERDRLLSYTPEILKFIAANEGSAK